MKLRFLVLIFIISGLMAACGGSGDPEPTATVPAPTATTASEPTPTPADTPAPAPEPTEEATEEDSDEDEVSSDDDDASEDGKTDRKAPLVSPLGDTSPLQGVSPLAAPAPTPIPLVKFELERPLKPGVEEISGSGPPNLPIVIIDITGGGDRLAEGLTDDDGNFTLELEAPLLASRRIGLTIGDLAGSGLTYEHFDNPGFYGDDAMMVPRIGIFYDTRMIVEE